MRGLKRLIKCPTRVTCSTSTLIDHILASFTSRVSQKGVIDIGISNHQPIFSTHKTSRLKKGDIHQHVSFRSFKNYAVDYFKEAHKQLDFQNYGNYDDFNLTYSNFVQKIMPIIDKIAPYRNKRITGNTHNWFDSEVLEKLNARYKLFKKRKIYRLNIDKKSNKKPKCDTSKLIITKKFKHSLKRSFQKQLTNLKNYGNLLSLYLC